MPNVTAFLVNSDDIVTHIVPSPASAPLIRVFVDIQKQLDIDVTEILYKA